jgi:hypothetical protein
LLAPLIFRGSNDDESWNWDDWAYYTKNRSQIWNNPLEWKNPDPAGWEGFATRVERFASHYSNQRMDKFVRDFSFIWGGIPNDVHYIEAGLSVWNGPHEIKYLNENNNGLRSDLFDKLGIGDNQSHHYAGIFFLGYYVTSPLSNYLAYGRDTDNPGDVALGEIAVGEANRFRNSFNYKRSLQGLVKNIRDLEGE